MEYREKLSYLAGRSGISFDVLDTAVKTIEENAKVFTKMALEIEESKKNLLSEQSEVMENATAHLEESKRKMLGDELKTEIFDEQSKMFEATVRTFEESKRRIFGEQARVTEEIIASVEEMVKQTVSALRDIKDKTKESHEELTNTLHQDEDEYALIDD
jgi:NADH dehydrogenase/NADH:ubiquinone oxidoreductase subunit G